MGSLGEYAALICSLAEEGLLEVEGSLVGERKSLGRFIGLEVKVGKVRLVVSLSKEGTTLYLDQMASIFRVKSKPAETGGEILTVELLPKEGRSRGDEPHPTVGPRG